MRQNELSQLLVIIIVIVAGWWLIKRFGLMGGPANTIDATVSDVGVTFRDAGDESISGDAWSE
jgi:hypothetical protein